MNTLRLIFLACIILFLVCVHTAPLEARPHHRHAHVQVGVRNTHAVPCQTVIRRYAAPVAMPVYAAPGYYSPGYVAPGHLYAVPVYPGYIEEIYSAQPRPRPLNFSGVSFSLNFFR